MICLPPLCSNSRALPPGWDGDRWRLGTDSGSHLASTLPAAPGTTSPGYHEGPCGRCSRKGQHLGPCHQCCPRPCPHPSQCQAPFSYLKGRSAVEFTPANDWLLLILATRTRRCGRADSDIVECDLEGLPAGHETAGSAAAVRTGRVPPRLGTVVAPTQQGGRGTWICPRTAPCEPREEADAQCPTSRPAS